MGSWTLDEVTDCRFGLAETLQMWGELIMDSIEKRDYENCTAAEARALEIESCRQACSLFKTAVDHYKEVRTGLEVRIDALVNCGNTYATWALARMRCVEESQEDRESIFSLLTQAEECYKIAVGRKDGEEDASVWSNLADVLVQHGECNFNFGQHPESVLHYFNLAKQAYQRSCSLSSSENGDDLAGLLLNWGSGLLTAARHSCDGSSTSLFLDESIALLKDCIAFHRGDVAPYIALGDALAAKAEKLVSSQQRLQTNLMIDAQTQQSQQSALILIQQALQDGYSAALRIQSSEPEALVGIAECHVQMARLSILKEHPESQTGHWEAAAQAYSEALGKLRELGNAQQRADVQYNYACCLSRTGKLQEAAAVVNRLVNLGYVSINDVWKDEDLVALHVLLNQAQNHS
jgi:tetratricopeptide (TPR) repeat protein